MGSVIEQGCNPTEYMPKISFNASGSTHWSGSHERDLSGLDVVSILEFCKTEGWCKGWNDAVQGATGRDANGPFHEALLGGFPAAQWKQSYQEGTEDCLTKYPENRTDIANGK